MTCGSLVKKSIRGISFSSSSCSSELPAFSHRHAPMVTAEKLPAVRPSGARLARGLSFGGPGSVESVPYRRASYGVLRSGREMPGAGGHLRVLFRRVEITTEFRC